MAKTYRVGVAKLVHDHVWGELRRWKELPNVEVVAAGDVHQRQQELGEFRRFSQAIWCRPESGWNLEWRILRSHQGIASGGKVNWLIDGLCGKRLPTVNSPHVDLS